MSRNTRLAANQNAVGIIDLSSGQGTETDPVPVSRLIDVQSNYIDGRGNLSQQRNDAHGRSIMTVDVTHHKRPNRVLAEIIVNR